MARERENTIDVIGGGFDHLLHLTGGAVSRLAAASLIFHPEKTPSELISAFNAKARTSAYLVEAQAVAAAAAESASGEDVVLILEDGQADPAFLKQCSVKALGGAGLRYYPTVSLQQEACRRCGVTPVNVMRLSGAQCREAPSPKLRRLLSGADPLWGVIYDGRLLWPSRRLNKKNFAGMVERVPGQGAVFIVRAKARSFWRGGLTGRGVVVTRPLAQADELGRLLIGYGATPFYFPTIALAPPPDAKALSGALKRIGDYHGLILTSVNAVARFLDGLADADMDARSLSRLRIYAVGAKTAESLRMASINPDAVPADFRAEGLIAILEKAGVRGRRFLLPRAEEGRDILPDRLRELGGEVDVISLYRTVTAPSPGAELLPWLEAGMIDAVTFTSGSALHRFIEITGAALGKRVLTGSAVACIGPVAAAAVREAGYESAVIPSQATVEKLADALDIYFRVSRRKQ